MCIPDVFLCDYDNDCGDSSDEGSFCDNGKSRVQSFPLYNFGKAEFEKNHSTS